MKNPIKILTDWVTGSSPNLLGNEMKNANVMNTVNVNLIADTMYACGIGVFESTLNEETIQDLEYALDDDSLDIPDALRAVAKRLKHDPKVAVTISRRKHEAYLTLLMGGFYYICTMSLVTEDDAQPVIGVEQLTKAEYKALHEPDPEPEAPAATSRRNRKVDVEPDDVEVIEQPQRRTKRGDTAKTTPVIAHEEGYDSDEEEEEIVIVKPKATAKETTKGKKDKGVKIELEDDVFDAGDNECLEVIAAQDAKAYFLARKAQLETELAAITYALNSL